MPLPSREQVLSLLRVEAFYTSYFDSIVKKGNELVAKCPFHDDTTPSFSINSETGLWRCHAGCGGGSVFDFVMRKENIEFKQAFEIVCQSAGVDAIPYRAATKPKPAIVVEEEEKPEIPESIVDVAYERLTRADDLMKFLHEHRGITTKTIVDFKLGWDGERYTIPIRDEHGVLKNIRRYKPKSIGKDKMISFAQFSGKKKFTYGQARLFPLPLPDGDPIIFCEGEMDCMIATQEGFHAVTATSGAGTFNPEWAPLFAGLDVVIAFDNDRAGRVGAQNVAKNLEPVAKSVRILHWPAIMPEKGDVTDWFVPLGETAATFSNLIDSARPYVKSAEEPKKPDGKEVKVGESSLAEYNGRPIKMRAMVSGKDTTPFVVPRKIEAWCDQNNGDACQSCGMCVRYHGKAKIEFKDNDRSTLGLIKCSDNQQKGTIAAKLGIRSRCTRWNMQIEESMNIEQVYVIPEISGKLQQNEEGEYVTRTVYAMKHGIKPNSVYKFDGYAYSDYRDQRATALFGTAEEAEVSIDKFDLSDEQMIRLLIFQPKDGQTPNDKMHEIAKEMEKVHRIRGREALQIVYDLGWHSALSFNCFGQPQFKGWVEVFVVGDSGMGKTTMFNALCDWYRAGQRVQAEQSSSAGLIGGLTRRGDDWVINWGPVVLNDRRLLGLDEWSGVAEEDAERMTDVRSTGVAEIVKIHREKAYARTRLVFMSNPKDGRPLSGYEHGVESIRTLFKKAEDVRRIDIAITVQSGDVKLDTLNVIEEEGRENSCAFSSDDCSALVLWAWSRKVEHIKISMAAQEALIGGAMYLSKKYTSHIPLIEPADVRWKLARLATAAAARLFSTADGVHLHVEDVHAIFAINILDEIYSSPSMGYERYSARRNAAEQWVQNHRDEIIDGIKTLMENPAELVELLMGESYVSIKDMEYQLGVDRQKIKDILLFLTKQKCLFRTTRGYRKTPVFITLLREIEDTLLPVWKMQPSLPAKRPGLEWFEAEDEDRFTL